MFSNKQIADYYDQTEVHYRRFWKLDTHFAIHYGIWEKGIRNFGEALENTNRILAERAGISSSSNILDAGCGIGGSALYLARNRGCCVTGISLSNKQIDRANQISSLNSLDHLLKFEVQDYTQTSFPRGNFDIVWALESAGTAHDKGAFLREACRVLKSGGLLVLADYFKTIDEPAGNQTLLKSWLELWAVSDLETPDSFNTLLNESGFYHIEMEDFTREITPSSKRMYLSSLLGSASSVIYNLFHTTTPFAKQHYKSGFLQYRALRKGLWEYKVITARKVEVRNE